MDCLAMNSQEDLLLKDQVNSRITRDNRKRGRNAEDESSEFMPLSKRINNLHINNLSGMQVNMTENMDADWSNKSFLPSPNYSDLSQGSPLYDGCSSSQSSYTAEYKPGLDAFENPFYYENYCRLPIKQFLWEQTQGWINRLNQMRAQSIVY
nr:uncharacterized protein LOC117224477 [Megalopta genalis]XP_033333339.1 uncharacterized protein LOC117224477 [Megalopta genalis]